MPLRASWAQHGEDLALLSLADFPEKGFYVDLGAHHPIRFSITNALYHKGWQGLNIEANPRLIENFYKSRQRDLNLNAAISSSISEKLYIFKESALSTTDEERAKWLIEQGRELIEEIEVPTRSLRYVFDEYLKNQKCDFLNLDIEGRDLDALVSLDFDSLEESKYPAWIMLETLPPVENALGEDSVRYLVKYGYKPVVVLPRATLLKHKP